MVIDSYGWVAATGGLIISVRECGLPRFLSVVQHDLMADIAKKLLFFEVKSDSGSFRAALKYHKRKVIIMCAPYEIGNLYGEGGNHLVACGVAKLVCSADDVLKVSLDIPIDIERNKKVIFGYRKKSRLLTMIRSGVSDTESLLAATHGDIGRLYTQLEELIDSGVIYERDGKYFCN